MNRVWGKRGKSGAAEERCAEGCSDLSRDCAGTGCGCEVNSDAAAKVVSLCVY